MARTTILVPIQKAVDAQTILSTFSNVMSQYGYQEKLVKVEQCWTKGNGVFVLQQNFGIAIGPDKVVLQGWTGDALMGESSLDGFMGMAIKKKMKKILEEAQRVISNLVR